MVAMHPHRAVSLTESVHARLRADLLACRLAPGEKLKIDELCRTLCAGSSAVREALSRLASEGLVSIEPQRGFRVKELSLDELRDLTQTRIRIEALCIRDAVAHGDVEWETALVASLHRMKRTPIHAEGDPKRYGEAFAVTHTAFHEALVSACPSRWMLTLRRVLYTQHERYRRLSRPLARVERDLDREHQAIADAALARDAERCATLMDEHLSTTARILMEAGQAELTTARTGPSRPGAKPERLEP